MCLRILADDLRRSVDSHIENRISWNVLILPFTGFLRESSFSLTNFVTLSGPRAREQKSHGTRGMYTMAASSDHCRIIVAEEAVLLIVLSCVSISMATGNMRRSSSPKKSVPRLRPSLCDAADRQVKTFSHLSRH